MTATRSDAMTLTINDTTMTGDHSDCTARSAPDRKDWEVSWLSGQILDCHTAITGMTLTDTAAEHDLHDRHQLWPLIQKRAAEFGPTALQTIARASQPHESATPRKDASAERADPEAGP